jgi:hypothetical protein
MQKWQLLEVGFELFSWSWIPCRKKICTFVWNWKEKQNQVMGGFAFCRKKATKQMHDGVSLHFLQKRLKWNHKCKNQDSKGKKVLKHTMVYQNETSRRRRRRRRRRWYTHVVITFKITKHKMDCLLLVFSQELHTQVNSTLCGNCEAMGRFF